MCVCVCVCVCMRERQRQRETETDRDSQRDRQTETETDRKRVTKITNVSNIYCMLPNNIFDNNNNKLKIISEEKDGNSWDCSKT